MFHRLLLFSFLLIGLNTLRAYPDNSGYFNIRDFGALGDSATNCTRSIQKAIDACFKNGGGTVHVPSGVYMTGTLFIRNNVALQLDAGSELRAVPDIREFPVNMPGVASNFNPFFWQALIYAEDADNIAITGMGMINGQGQDEAFKQRTNKRPERYQNRPTLMRIVNCENVKIEHITLRNSAFWTLHLMASKNIVVHGITLQSRTANYNNDGIDVDGCENVRISDCHINSYDDAISIKATGNHPCRKVMVNNCILSSACNAVRVGAENFAGFEDIQFSDCHIYESRNGITFQNIDGFPMKRISFRGISLYEVATPVYVITGRKSYPIGVPEEEFPCPPKEKPASISDLVFDNITGDKIGYYRGAGVGNVVMENDYRNAIVISGHPEALLRRCRMSNISLNFTGGGTVSDMKTMMPEINERPNPNFESSPVYGIMARYADNLVLSNINLSYDSTDIRSAISLENCSGSILQNLYVESEGESSVIDFFGDQKPRVVNSFGFTKSGAIREISEKNGSFSESRKSFFIRD